MGWGGGVGILSDKAASRGQDKRNICICEGEENIKAVFKGAGSWGCCLVYYGSVLDRKAGSSKRQ